MRTAGSAKANGIATDDWLSGVLTLLPITKGKHLDNLLPTSLAALPDNLSGGCGRRW